MEPVALRPRKATEIVDAAVEVYRRNPVQFLLITAAVHVPWLVIQILIVGNRNEVEALPAQVLISAGTMITWYLISGLVLQLASDIYLGEESDALQALRRVGPRVIPVLIASIIQTVLLFLGLLFFLLPAVWISAVLFAVAPAIVIERRGVIDAIRRSATLSRGLKTHILSALGLVVIIRFAVQLGVAILMQGLSDRTLQYTLAGLSSIVVYPLLGIAEALIYYDARIRKEGFDIELMAARASAQAPAAT